MAARRPNDILAHLQSKGFRDHGGPDRKLILYVNGQRTGIWTQVGRHNKDYDDRLLGLMRRQLRLDRLSDLLRLIDCPMDHDEYVAVLRGKGAIVLNDDVP